MAGSGQRAGQGFTLIELLIAMFIFAVVISSVYGAYRATFSIIHSSEEQMAISRSGQVAIERISDDLRSLVAGQGGLFRGERQEVSGIRADRLTFVSAAHLALSRKDKERGYAMIGYAAAPDERSGLLNLYRLDRVLVPGLEEDKSETPGEILATGLLEVSFSYRGVDGRETDEWDSEEGVGRSPEGQGEPPEPELPVLVHVKLVFAPGAADPGRVVEAREDSGGVTFKTAVALPLRAKGRERR